jgi:hypothetical protein
MLGRTGDRAGLGLGPRSSSRVEGLASERPRASTASLWPVLRSSPRSSRAWIGPRRDWPTAGQPSGWILPHSGRHAPPNASALFQPGMANPILLPAQFCSQRSVGPRPCPGVTVVRANRRESHISSHMLASLRPQRGDATPVTSERRSVSTCRLMRRLRLGSTGQIGPQTPNRRGRDDGSGSRRRWEFGTAGRVGRRPSRHRATDAERGRVQREGRTDGKTSSRR